eukprot:CAMPEP_0198114794 /NCGR_PEP_ID=MMETSP1442-20131203/6077_1 /TAXON_ID= /ORGANISM="Craspedostauros australis, Strain CCMP3328" /LENGTH=284 /DNA_ID=CAMNT_0043772185 /DNA_START=151 /DNA_END=1002 /DNA_ORIENTATION=-
MIVRTIHLDPTAAQHSASYFEIVRAFDLQILTLEIERQILDAPGRNVELGRFLIPNALQDGLLVVAKVRSDSAEDAVGSAVAEIHREPLADFGQRDGDLLTSLLHYRHGLGQEVGGCAGELLVQCFDTVSGDVGDGVACGSGMQHEVDSEIILGQCEWVGRLGQDEARHELGRVGHLAPDDVVLELAQRKYIVRCLERDRVEVGHPREARRRWTQHNECVDEHEVVEIDEECQPLILAQSKYVRMLDGSCGIQEVTQVGAGGGWLLDPSCKRKRSLRQAQSLIR